MRRLLLALIFAVPGGASAQSLGDQFALACKFPTIPETVFYYSRPGTSIEAAMTVGGRGPVVMSLGAGSARYEGGEIDGYSFQWSPQNSWMDVFDGGKTIRSEQGECRQVHFGSQNPLRF